jgi:pilus assembly protein CpaB
MNTKRLVVLGIALVAASGAALLARGMMGGGTPKVEAKVAPQIVMSEVLVANTALQPGQALSADQVRWEKWPANSVDSSFITHDAVSSVDDAVKGTVVRTPIISGQPITNTEIVHANAAGFMAAMLNPGMRAVSITITTDSGAGGFILPNDRVDLILTQKTGGDVPHVRVHTILQNVRVLAVDQTFKQDKDTKTVIAKTATLELTPLQAEQVARAQNQGMLSLSLRPLGDDAANSTVNPTSSMASAEFGRSPFNPARGAAAAINSALGSSGQDNGDDDAGAGGDSVSIIRYGITHDAKPAQEKAQ